jgi:predicted ATP-grasp superfamily ATP-dependent carboligase
VVVKPRIGYRFAGRFGIKLFVARDRAELRRALERLAGAELEGMVFDLVPGGDDRLYAYCTYVDASGAAHDGVTVRKLRQSPPFFGVARVAHVVPEIPELRATTLALLRRIGFRGFAAAEFKHDPRDGSFRFLEVNGRSVIYNALLRAAGLDVAALAWADLVEGRVAPWRTTVCGGAWVNAHADLLYGALYRRLDPIGLAEMIAPYGRQRIDAVWSAHDPYPFLAQWARSARDGGRALWHGTHRELLAGRTPVQRGS